MKNPLDAMRVGIVGCIGCTMKVNLLNVSGLGGDPTGDYIADHKRHRPVSQDEPRCPGSGHKPRTSRQSGEFIRV